MDNDEKFERVVELPNNHRLVDHGTKTVTLTGVNGDADLLISVFVNVGINHPHPEDLAETIKVTYDSTNINIKNPYHIDSGDEKAGNPDHDTSLYVTEEIDFSGWGSIPSTWSVEIEDTENDGEVGILEQFEVVLNSYTDPTEADSDNDGLNDSEEANLGRDGYITDPNVPDMDGDGWNDGAEFAHKTDPANPDTDRDGVNDSIDIDPLHDLILQVKVTKLRSCDKYKDHNMKVNVTIDETNIEGSETLDFLSQEYVQGSDIEFYVSVDIDDSASSSAEVQVTLKTYKAYQTGDNVGDLLLDTDGAINHRIMENDKYGFSKGFAQGDDVEYGAVWYEINTLSYEKTNTYFITAKDDSQIFTSEKGVIRYTSVQRYYCLIMNVDNDHQEMIIIPESIFYDSKLGSLLLDDDISDEDMKDTLTDWGLDDLQFSSADDEKDELSKYVMGAWAIDLTTSQIEDVIHYLTANLTDAIPYKDILVQDFVWTLGLPDEVLELVPAVTPKLSPLTLITIVEKWVSEIEEWVEENGIGFLSQAWGFVKKPLTKLVKVVRETVNYVAQIAVAVVTNNPAVLAQALRDVSNFVRDELKSFAKSAVEFTQQVNAFLMKLALNTLVRIIERLKEIKELIDSLLDFFITWAIKLVKAGFQIFMSQVQKMKERIVQILTLIEFVITNEEFQKLNALILLIYLVIFEIVVGVFIGMLGFALLCDGTPILGAIFGALGVVLVNLVFYALFPEPQLALGEAVISLAELITNPFYGSDKAAEHAPTLFLSCFLFPFNAIYMANLAFTHAEATLEAAVTYSLGLIALFGCLAIIISESDNIGLAAIMLLLACFTFSAIAKSGAKSIITSDTLGQVISYGLFYVMFLIANGYLLLCTLGHLLYITPG